MAGARAYWSTLPRDPAADGFAPANWYMDPLHMRGAGQGAPNLPWSKYPPALGRLGRRAAAPYAAPPHMHGEAFGEHYLGIPGSYAPHPFFVAGPPALPGAFWADAVGAPRSVLPPPALRDAALPRSPTADPKRVLSLRHRLENIGREIAALRADGGIARSGAGRRACFCTTCGKRAGRTANFCAFCGAAVRKDAAADRGGSDEEGSGSPPLGGEAYGRFDTGEHSGGSAERDVRESPRVGRRRELRGKYQAAIHTTRHYAGAVRQDGPAHRAREEPRSHHAGTPRESRMRKGGPGDAEDSDTRSEKIRRAGSGGVHQHQRHRSPQHAEHAEHAEHASHHSHAAHQPSARGPAPPRQRSDSPRRSVSPAYDEYDDEADLGASGQVSFREHPHEVCSRI